MPFVKSEVGKTIYTYKYYILYNNNFLIKKLDLFFIKRFSSRYGTGLNILFQISILNLMKAFFLIY